MNSSPWVLLLLFPSFNCTSIFSALNEMEEVAPEEGMAAGQGHSDVPAHSQAVVPMEVDEEQAGNYAFGKKPPFGITSQGVKYFSVSLVINFFFPGEISGTFEIMLLAQLISVKKFSLF